MDLLGIQARQNAPAQLQKTNRDQQPFQAGLLLVLGFRTSVGKL